MTRTVVFNPSYLYLVKSNRIKNSFCLVAVDMGTKVEIHSPLLSHGELTNLLARLGLRRNQTKRKTKKAKTK